MQAEDCCAVLEVKDPDHRPEPLPALGSLPAGNASDMLRQRGFGSGAARRGKRRAAGGEKDGGPAGNDAPYGIIP